jgi:transposase
MVQIDRMKIKYAGQKLGINESTAKRIVKKFRTEGTIT